MKPGPRTREIHCLISRLLMERGTQDPLQEELNRDPILAYGNVSRYFSLGGFDVSQCESCDGFFVSWVIKGKECLYKDRSYDGRLYEIVVFESGEWEDLLKQEVRREYNYGCIDREWIEQWRDNVDSSKD